MPRISTYPHARGLNLHRTAALEAAAAKSQNCGTKNAGSQSAGFHAAKRPALKALVLSFSISALLALGAQTALAETNSGGAAYAPIPTLGPGQKATISADGRTAIAPVGAPLEVQKAIWAANKITRKPYIYGGGHKAFRSRGYDCSGTVSYALHGGGLLKSPLDSSSFMKWGEAGAGTWITVFTNPGHAYAVIAGLRLDTSGPGERGPRWRSTDRSDKGFRARHPQGF